MSPAPEGTEVTPADPLEEQEEEVAPGSPWAQLVFAVAAVVVGAVLVQQATTIRGDLSPSGPRFLPSVVGVGWLLLSLAYCAGVAGRLARGRAVQAAERLDHLPRVLGLLVLLVAYALLLDPVGYLVTTTVFLAAASAVLGSRSHVRDAVVAVVLAVALYFLFSRSLGIFLPAGVIPV